METLINDIRYGIRSLLKRPGFTAVALITLALGIGANTTIFSVVNSVLLRPLPYSQPDQLLQVNDSLASAGFPQAGLTQMEFVRLRTESKSFAHVGAFQSGTLTLTGAGEPERVRVTRVSDNLFTLLGINPELGRAFIPGEDEQSRSNVVMLSHDFWQSHFAANPNVLNQAVTLGGTSMNIVGVLPAGFQSPADLQNGVGAQLVTPLGLNLASLNLGSHGVNTIARLRAGVSPSQAASETNLIIGRVVKEDPTYYPTDGSFHSFLTPLHESIVGSVRLALLVLLGAVGLVLLIACANVANLLLARGETRQKEISIRVALGATRWRIIRQLLAESFILALIGGSAGLMLAWSSLDLLLKLNPGNIPRLEHIGLEPRVLVFTLMLSLVTAFIFGLAPALRSAKSDLHSTLKATGRSSSATRGWLGQVLVVSEVALAMLLLVGAGLLIKSFRRLERVDTGLRTDHVLTMRLSLGASAYQKSPQIIGFYDRVLEQVRYVPGVEAAAITDNLPLSGNDSDTMMEIEGRPFDVKGLQVSTDFRVVTPDYFRVIGAQLSRGRTFSEADQEGVPLVALVNETIARNHWPNEDPIGKHLRLLDAPPAQATTSFMTIVGVVANAKNRGLAAETRQEIYVPLKQHGTSIAGLGLRRSTNLTVRTSVDPLSLATSVKEKVWSVDRNVPIANVQTMDQLVQAGVVQQRFYTIMLGIFASVALALGAIGIYGVISFSVGQRTKEIGIRMALGARGLDILRLVFRDGLGLTLIGIALGLAGALALTRVLTSLLFEVSTTDPLTFTLVALMLLSVALLACYVPARRATRVDPLVALRYE
ncbi:MAG TPA: ABC transporter permease [Pyrinomonadaceae bacterium]|nr:ABC transporter permease [Pyrinomonadaceae bacterium]